MNLYSRKTAWKYLLFSAAILIGLSSLVYTNRLVKELSREERKKVELWARATKKLIEMEVSEGDFELLFEVIENNNTVPVILTNENLDTISTRNLESSRLKNPHYITRQLEKMMSKHEPIVIMLGTDERNYIFYKDSILLSKLQYFPFIQLAVIFLFIAVSYYAFSASRRAEQNQVWVGLTKETAHQLGTPTSSLIAWLELIKIKKTDERTIVELEKDVKRLEKIADRFSKIGSRPVLEKTNLLEVVTNTVNYLHTRSSENILFEIKAPEHLPLVHLNPGLFEWVIENLCKNSMDAVGSSGKISIAILDAQDRVFIDVMDEGKGIPKKLHKMIFKPGYTSKPRGWGLGLSLSKRIVENYHKGKIFVLRSEQGKGTTIRIILKK